MWRSNAHCRCPKSSAACAVNRVQPRLQLVRCCCTSASGGACATIATQSGRNFGGRRFPVVAFARALFNDLCDAAEGRLASGLAGARSTLLTEFAATGTGVCQSHVHAPLGEFLIETGRAQEAVQRLDARIESAIRRRRARLSVRTLPSARVSRTRDLGALDAGARGHSYRQCDIARFAGRGDACLRRAEESQRAITAEAERPLRRSDASYYLN